MSSNQGLTIQQSSINRIKMNQRNKSRQRPQRPASRRYGLNSICNPVQAAHQIPLKCIKEKYKNPVESNKEPLSNRLFLSFFSSSIVTSCLSIFKEGAEGGVGGVDRSETPCDMQVSSTTNESVNKSVRKSRNPDKHGSQWQSVNLHSSISVMQLHLHKLTVTGTLDKIQWDIFATIYVQVDYFFFPQLKLLFDGRWYIYPIGKCWIKVTIMTF